MQTAPYNRIDNDLGRVDFVSLVFGIACGISCVVLVCDIACGIACVTLVCVIACGISCVSLVCRIACGIACVVLLGFSPWQSAPGVETSNW